jgi:hypothetical protein
MGARIEAAVGLKEQALAARRTASSERVILPNAARADAARASRRGSDWARSGLPADHPISQSLVAAISCDHLRDPHAIHRRAHDPTGVTRALPRWKERAHADGL